VGVLNEGMYVALFKITISRPTFTLPYSTQHDTEYQFSLPKDKVECPNTQYNILGLWRGNLERLSTSSINSKIHVQFMVSNVSWCRRSAIASMVGQPNRSKKTGPVPSYTTLSYLTGIHYKSGCIQVNNSL
jgi:hypothetical protein